MVRVTVHSEPRRENMEQDRVIVVGTFGMIILDSAKQRDNFERDYFLSDGYRETLYFTYPDRPRFVHRQAAAE